MQAPNENAPAPKDTIISGSVNSDRYEFPLRVKSNVSFSTGRVLSYDIRLGGHVHSTNEKDVCVFISITAPPAPRQQEDEFLPSYNISNKHECTHEVACIIPARYDKCCAVGATRPMLWAACAYVVRVFPWVKWFSLADKSYVTTAMGQRVPLATLSLCTSGATWYEREFGAQIRDAAAHKKYRHLVESLLQTPGAKPNTITELCSQARVQPPDRDACEQMEACYAGASTLQAFFCALKESRSSDEYTMLVGHWVNDLLNSMLDQLHRMEWLVPVCNFQSVDIQVGASNNTVVHPGHWHMPAPSYGRMSHLIEDMFHPIEDI